MQATEAYVRGRFASVSIATDPFPHFVLPDVLPPDLYAAMEQSLPPQWRWTLSAFVEDLLHAHRPFPLGRATQPRFGVRQPDQGASFSLSRYRHLWLERFAEIVETIDLLTIEAFTPHIDRYRSRMEHCGIKLSKQVIPGQALFCQRSDIWKIEPHTHNLPQLIQSMLYFPLPGSEESQGTVLYRIKNSQTVPASEFAATRTFDPASIERAGILPYRANTLVSFMNTPEAVHSTNDIAGPRRRYIFSCIQADIEIGNADITIGGSLTDRAA